MGFRAKKNHVVTFFCVAALTLGFALAPSRGHASLVSPVNAIQATGVASSKQVVLGITDRWTSSTATLYRFERTTEGGWVHVGNAVPARLGPNGLAWGIGIAGANDTNGPAAKKGPSKVEGDGRAPAGAFNLGPVFGYDRAWVRKTAMPFVTVGPKDLFVEDPESPLYNTHIRLDHLPVAAWETREQMQQGDAAHRFKVFVGHNANPPIAGKGSAIFIHIWRGKGTKVTSGCTAMNATALEAMVRWLNPAASPVYVLLPRDVYQEVQSSWGLPEL